MSSFQNATTDDSTMLRLGELNIRKNEDCLGTTCLPQPQDFDISKNDFIIHEEYGPIINDKVQGCHKHLIYGVPIN